MASRPVSAPPSTRQDVVMRAALRKAFSLPVVLAGLLVVGVAVFVRLNLADPEFAKPYTRDARTAFAPDICGKSLQPKKSCQRAPGPQRILIHLPSQVTTGWPTSGWPMC